MATLFLFQKLWAILEEKHTPPDFGEEQVHSHTDGVT